MRVAAALERPESNPKMLPPKTFSKDRSSSPNDYARLLACRSLALRSASQRAHTYENPPFSEHSRTTITMDFYRSEEHTSALPSIMRISYAVFCSKKKKNTNNNIIN